MAKHIAKKSATRRPQRATQRVFGKSRASPAKITQSAPTAPAASKKATVIEMLRRPGGATVDNIKRATNWQAHSVRAILTTLRGAGLQIESAKKQGEPRVYKSQ